MTLYFHSWQYLVRGWLYRDIIFSLLTIFSEGVNISWHYIFTPGNIWWGGDYIVTYFHSWRYLVRGVIISWHYNIISDTTIEFGTGGDYIWIFSLSKFDSAVIPGFYYSYPYIHPMKLGWLKWLYLSMIPSLPSLTGTSSIIAGVLFNPMSSSMGVNIVPRCIHPSV